MGNARGLFRCALRVACAGQRANHRLLFRVLFAGNLKLRLRLV
jgi:hypothetical protein